MNLSSQSTGDMFALEELTFTGTKSQKLYLRKCADFKITPCSHFVKSLSSKEIDLEHHNVGSKGVEACAFALAVRVCFCPFWDNNQYMLYSFLPSSES